MIITLPLEKDCFLQYYGVLLGAFSGDFMAKFCCVIVNQTVTHTKEKELFQRTNSGVTQKCFESLSHSGEVTTYFIFFVEGIFDQRFYIILY